MKRMYRLRRNEEFQQLRRVGRSKANRLMVLSFAPNGLPHSRIGFVTSKRLGKAVIRNKVKRRLREAVRLKFDQIKPGFDIVFIARQPIVNAEYRQIARAVDQLLQQSALMISHKTQEVRE